MLPTNYIQSPIPIDLAEVSDNQPLGFNVEIELDALEELIVNSTHVPLTEFIVIDRVVVLHQLNQIKEHLPVDLATALAIANRKREIIAEAENYAAALVKSAQEKATQILHDSSILRQAELDGAKMRLKTEQECEHLKQATLNEVRELHQNAIAESQAIQQGADDYADHVLGDIEQKIQQMLLIIQHGRQQLHGVNSP
jgi:vacuolar-type H+-ATPase subunit H